MNSGYAIQCSSMRRIHRKRNALRRWRARALMYTTRAPERCAAAAGGAPCIVEDHHVRAPASDQIDDGRAVKGRGRGQQGGRKGADAT